MKNVIQLYFDNGKETPFVVRRRNWSKSYGLVVTEVHPRKSGDSWYGDAVGYGLPPLDGSDGNDYWGTPDNPKEVSCAGCYQWKMIEEIPDEWEPYVDG